MTGSHAVINDNTRRLFNCSRTLHSWQGQSTRQSPPLLFHAGATSCLFWPILSLANSSLGQFLFGPIPLFGQFLFLANSSPWPIPLFGQFLFWPIPLLAKSSFGQIVIWPNRHLAKSSFGQFLFWPIPLLANSSFGQFLFWPIPLLANSSFGQLLLWPAPLLANSSFGQLLFWPNALLANSQSRTPHQNPGWVVGCEGPGGSVQLRVVVWRRSRWNGPGGGQHVPFFSLSRPSFRFF